MKFGDFAQINPRVLIPKDTEVSFVEMADLIPGIRSVKPSVEKHFKGSCSKFSDDDTLFSRITPCLQNGKICQVKNLKNRIGFGSTEFFVFRGKKGVSTSDFVYYLAQSELIKEPAIKSMVGASGRQRADLDVIRNIDVKLFSIDEQIQIASFLSNYDNLIENNNRRIAILEDMAQSLYREWFVNFRYPNHKDNVDAEGKPKLIDSPLGKIPLGWKVVALEDVCNKITDGAHKSPKSVEDGVPMASVKDMHDFGINASSCRQISYEDYEELKRQDSVVRANDILVAKDGSYLKHTFVVEKDLEMALLSSIAIIRPNDKVRPHWLAYCLRSPLVKERMKNCVSGAAIPRIILSDFRKFNLILPPKKLMNEWNSIAEVMVKQCWNLVARNKNLKQQRDMLLPKLISGQIELKD